MSAPLHSPRSLRTIVLLLALLLASWLAAFGYTVWRLKQDALANGMDRAATQVRNFEEFLTQTLKVIDITADTLDPQLKPQGGIDPLALERALSAALRPTPYLRSLSLLDANGRIVASSNPRNLGVQVDTRGFFPATGPESNVLRIDVPWRGRDFDTAKPPAAAPTNSPDPGFIPVLHKLSGGRQGLWLLAALNPDYFANHFSQLLDPAQGHVQWLRYDTRLLLSTHPNDVPGTTADSGITPEGLAQRESGRLTRRLSDGRHVLTAYRASSQFPVVLVVNIDRDRVLAAWREEARSLGINVLPILLALCIASVLVWRRQQRIGLQQIELERERLLAASVFDASSDAIILTRPDGEILAVNAAWEQLNEYGATEAIGRNPRMLQSGMQNPAFYRAMWDSLQRTGHWQGEIVNRRKGGSVYTALLTINAVTDASGKLLHYVSVATDISARKREEAQLAEHATALALAKEAAESANRAKSAFLANISHELRTPMNGIMGMTMLAKRRVTDPKAQAQLDTASRSAEGLLALINDLIEISSIEADRLKLEDLPFTLNSIRATVSLLVQRKANDKGLEFTLALEHSLGEIGLRGDPGRLANIILNLASNAVKFTEAGFVAIRFLAIDESPDELEMRVEVADSGIGLEPADQRRAFHLFEQGDGSRTRKYGGTGLGLALCKRLVESMGGTIGLSSTIGVGSTFWFVLRLRKDLQPLVPDAAVDAANSVS
ncbi:MAG: PAS domain S-box protein [Sulfuritalea sp.]|nr:PAS domain S-box protein [Sulfuritalea sp.]